MEDWKFGEFGRLTVPPHSILLTPPTHVAGGRECVMNKKTTMQQHNDKPNLVLSYIGIWLGSFLGLLIGSIHQTSVWWIAFGLVLLIVAMICLVFKGNTMTYKVSTGIALAIFAGAGFTTCGATQVPSHLESVQMHQ